MKKIPIILNLHFYLQKQKNLKDYEKTIDKPNIKIVLLDKYTSPERNNIPNPIAQMTCRSIIENDGQKP